VRAREEGTSMKKVGPKNPFGVTDVRVKPATEAQVKKLERRLGAELPADYRRFLKSVNGGRRPGGGWELPKYEISIDTFYGLRGDFYDLADAVDRLLKGERGTTHYPPDTIQIGYELGNNPILLKYRGKDAGSVWFWDEMGTEDWRKIAPSFDAFNKMLDQEPVAAASRSRGCCSSDRAGVAAPRAQSLDSTQRLVDAGGSRA
jgi:hypothetical protein